MTPTFEIQVDDPHCSVCGNGMDLSVLVPPFGSEYGLKVYTCPRCGRSESYLVPSRSKAA